MFEKVLAHLRRRGPVLVPSQAGELRVVADPCVSQIYVYDTEIAFWFAFIPWFGAIRAYAHRPTRAGDLETPAITLAIPATPTALVAKMTSTSADYIERIRRGR